MIAKSLRHALLAATAFALSLVATHAQPAATREEKLVVFAASSLQDVFAKLGEEFGKAHDAKVTFNFAGTQELRTQLEYGAPADVFAAADTKHMDELVKGSLVTAPVMFARNEPVIVVARESVDEIRSLGDLSSAERIVLGVPEVPIGRYTVQILDKASAKLGADFRSRVEAKVVSREANARQVLAKVSLGEADAGIVYRTDARSAGGDVAIVPIPLDINVIAEYPIAAVSGAPHPGLARAWLDFVLSADGQKRLRDAGFIAPTGGNKGE
jgi:molybdate transport system substrate-binding protein